MARTLSLEARQLLAASLGLIAFLGLTGYALDRAFTDAAVSSEQERMKGYSSAYLAGGEFTRSMDFEPPYLPPDARFTQPSSGLYAVVLGPDVDWRSASVLDRALPLDHSVPSGKDAFDGPLQVPDKNGGPPELLYRYARGIIWEQSIAKQKTRDIPFTFYVFEDASVLRQHVQVFRRALWGYLGAAALLLLGVQALILRWSLQPLRRVRRELLRVQRGSIERLGGGHPRELEPLTDSINAFIISEREHMERYRDTLSDLAHSLKTPLAVLRARLADDATIDELREDVHGQVQRMSEIVSYQLSRGATAGHKLFAVPLEIESRAEGIVVSLEKVYAGKRVLCEFDLDAEARFHGAEGDLMELMGNLLENAFKWARQRVVLSTRNEIGAGRRRPGLVLSVEDDGPGIPDDKVERLLQRGVRGDERVQGHGIGLSIVQNIVRAYHGELEVDRSPELGGARFTVRIPPGLL